MLKNNTDKRFIRLVMVVLLMTCGAFAGTAQKLPDTVHVTVRNFDLENINAYRSDPAFQYEEAGGQGSSPWDRFWSWIWNGIEKILRNPAGAVTVKAILIAAATLLLVIFAIRMAGMNRAGLFGKKNTGGPLLYSTAEEDINAIDFSEALQLALDNRNFRMAIRLLYLQSLKNLADRQLIQWQPDKTNNTYVGELADRQQRNSFHRLTGLFENYWYGNVPVQESEFYIVQQGFEQFNRQLG